MINDNENNEEVENNGDESSKPSPEYVKELLKEKVSLDPEQHSNAMRLLDNEVIKAQSLTGGKPLKPDVRYVDLVKEKPIKVSAKVLVPVKEHPKFNFVGKLLGPKGNSLKRLQEETMTKMAILGRGSMRDKAKEEELRNSLDPKYSHLCDELHVEIQAHASPAEAYARLAYALAEIRKYLIPDVNDDVRQEQLREFQQYSSGPGGRPPRTSAGAAASLPGGGGGPLARGAPGGRGGSRPPLMGPGRGVPPAALGGPGVPPHRSGQGKAKVMSILDKARTAMDEPYGPQSYDDGAYYDAPTPMTYGSAYNGSGFYDGGGYRSGGGESGGGGWKSYGPPNKRENAVGGKGSGMSGRFGNTRPSPYNRPK